MVNKVQRLLIEATKRAERIDIILNPESGNRICLHPFADKKFAHDVALAFQDYCNRRNNGKE